MKQSDIFLTGEGAAWIARNRNKPRDDDPVLKAMELLNIKPKNVLEIGCGDGWRLNKLRSNDCLALGVDPGASGKRYDPHISWETANNLPFGGKNYFDCVIFGFCLYLVDREDLFTVAAEADRVLQDGGWLIIHDFLPPMRPFARPYEHKEGVMSYHMDYAPMWLAHPWYNFQHQHSRNDEKVTVLHKDLANAFKVQA